MRIIITLISFFIIYSSFCQDIHWSQINSNPIYQNPANSGDIDGDYRFVFNLKDQWRKVTKPYESTSISFDCKYKYFQKIGVGGIFIADKTGDGVFKTFEFRILPSYQIVKINTTQTLRIGVDIGINNRQMTFNNYMYNNQFDGLIYNENMPNNENYTNSSKSNLILGVGMTYKNQINHSNSITSGIAVYNLNEPNQSFYGTDVPRSRRYHLFTNLNKVINHKFILIPSINFEFQNSYKELLLGAKIKYMPKNESLKKYSFNTGVSFRNRDAIIGLFGIDYKNQLFSGLSYDINISQLSKASNGKGGIEFSLIYILKNKNIRIIKNIKCIEYM